MTKLFFCLALFTFGQLAAAVTPMLDEYGTPLCSDGTAANYVGLGVAGLGISGSAAVVGAAWGAGVIVGASDLLVSADELEVLSSTGQVMGRFERTASKLVGRNVAGYITALGEPSVKMGVPNVATFYSLKKTFDATRAENRCAGESVKNSPGTALVIDPKVWHKIDATTNAER